MKGSWKTTLFGILAAAFGGVAAGYQGTTIGTIAMVLAGLCTGAIGFVARDNGVTSEQAGAKPAQPVPPASPGGFSARDASKPLLVLFVLSVLFSCPGCFGTRSEAASKANEGIEASAINFAKNRDKIDEGFLQLYREMSQAKADELAEAALKAEVKIDGTANVQNVKLILEKKAEHYALIEEQVVAMRRKILEADPDMENLLEYSKGLRTYFKQRASTGELLNKSGEQVSSMLAQFLGKKKGPPGLSP